MSGVAPLRCFVAIELPEPVRRVLREHALARIPSGSGVRVSKDAQLHLTLKFLGDVEPDLLPDVERAVVAASAAVEPFELILGQPGCFPGEARPRVLWVGLTDAGGGCQRWLAAAEPLLADLGIEPERRPFAPHVTLGRTKDDHPDGVRTVQRVVRVVKLPPGKPFRAEEVVLYRSELGPDGSRYSVLRRARLGELRGVSPASRA